MKKGFTAIVTAILLIAIGVIAAVGAYYWVGTLTSKPATPSLPGLLSAVPIGGKQVLIANLGTEPINTSELKLTGNATITCSPEIIEPGEQTRCTIENASGPVTIYGPGTVSTVINLNEDNSPPNIRSVSDNSTLANLYDEIGVNATISDDAGLKSVTLFYKPPGGVWTGKVMHIILGSKKAGTWNAGLNFSKLGTWEYYVLAEGTNGKIKKSQIHSFKKIIAYTKPTPHNGTKVNKTFVINVTAVTPKEVTLWFNGTNFTIYGGDDLYCSRGLGPWNTSISPGSSLFTMLNWHCSGEMLKHPGPINPDEFSLSLWIRYNPLFSWGTNSMSIYWSGDDCAGITLTKSSTQFKAKVGSPDCTSNSEVILDWSKMKNESWHMISITKNKTDIRLYFDGESIANITVGAEGKESSGSPIMVKWGGIPFWLQPDEVHLYNYTLTPKQIALLYHMSYGKYYAEMHDLGAGSYTFKVSAKTSLGEGVTEERSVTVV